MDTVDILYNSEQAINMLADRLAQEVRDNAILRASLLYYQSLLPMNVPPPQTFATVPYSDKPPDQSV